MRITIGLGVIGLLGAAACASGPLANRTQVDFAVASSAPNAFLHVGEASVVDARVNPLVPIDMAASGDDVAVAFGQRQSGVLAMLDPETAEAVSRAPSEPRLATGLASRGAQRVRLQGGRSLLCWTEGNMETGYRALAQEFEADGAARGEPIVISPPDADVMGAPRAASVDGRRVIATFAASVGGTFELIAVPLEGI
jgi:hypothetical protein